MEWKTDALVLRAVDYGENDRMLTLFTAARGKIGAGCKGVRRAGAKLKFAAQPFCFAEFLLAERGGRHTVTGASLYDGFYALREDIAAYYAGIAVLEACDGLLYEEMESSELFVAAVSALGRLAEGGGAPALVKFLLDALRYAGWPVQADGCGVCGKPLSGRMAFDMTGGSFVCPDCADASPASESTYTAIRAAQGKGEGTSDGYIRALRLLGAYFYHHTEQEIPALSEYLKLLS